MQRKIDTNRLVNSWVERIVWNVAAATALTAMIVVLLCSLRWLDQIDPDAASHGASYEQRARLDPGREIEDRPAVVSRFNGPSG